MYRYILFFILFIVFISIYRFIRDQRLLHQVTKRSRGTSSERKLIMRLLKIGIPPENIFHDLYVNKDLDYYSQIDTVIVTEVGLVVIEVKDYSGWIYGKGWQEYWIKMLAHGKKKYRFYNPVLQNKGHIKALKDQIPELRYTPVYSVIVFYGECVFKDISQIPDNVHVIHANKIKSTLGRILRKNDTVTYHNKAMLLKKLKYYVDNGAKRSIRAQHIIDINEDY